MRIAQVAPLYESVPPKLYGGTERVVSYLTEELVRLGPRGHPVRQRRLADARAAGARLPAGLVAGPGLPGDAAAPRPADGTGLRGRRPRSTSSTSTATTSTSRWSGGCPCPSVTTLHGRLHLPDLQPLFAEYAEVPLVSISDDQRRPLPWANWQATVYHGLPRGLHTFRERPGDYLAFLGRMSPEKRLDRAIEIARRAGMKLKVAAKIYPGGARLFRADDRAAAARVAALGRVHRRGRRPGQGRVPGQRPRPAVPDRLAGAVRPGDDRGDGLRHAGHRLAQRLGARGDRRRRHRLRRRQTSTRRCEAVGRVAGLSRRACRQVFEERFDAARMARDYVRGLPAGWPAAARGPSRRCGRARASRRASRSALRTSGVAGPSGDR